METSFDLGAVLDRNKKHKCKPTQFTSVALGIKKRLETNIKNRKSGRSTVFDSVRDLSHTPLTIIETKINFRRQQLEKWKAEKEKLKKKLAAQKKKPFVAGVVTAPLKYVPPPPPNATTSRVTRSQTRKQNVKQNDVKPSSRSTYYTKSFAPDNATFKPQIKLAKQPTLVPVTKTINSKKNCKIIFSPVLPNQKPTTARLNVTAPKVITESKSKLTHSKTQITGSKVTKEPNSKVKMFTNQSSLSSESEENIIKKIRGNSKEIIESNSDSNSMQKSIIKTKNLRKPIKKGKSLRKPNTPENPLKSESSTEIKYTNNQWISEQEIKKLKDCPESNSVSDSVQKSITTTLNIRKSINQGMSSSAPQSNTPTNPPKSESSSEEKLRSPRSPLEWLKTPEQITDEYERISPHVTVSRGKDKARKEMKEKMDLGLLEEDISNMEDVKYFRRQLNSEIARMTEMCETWDKISEQTTLPESVQGLVLLATCKARLLMSQKLQQFASLIEQCAHPEPGTALITPTDLHGFWDMVFIQVINVDKQFKELEDLKGQGWEEKQPIKKATHRKNVVKNAHTKNVVKPAAGLSKLREMIAAARKVKKQQKSNVLTLHKPEDSKTFEAGFFNVTSPVRSPVAVATTPANRASLLKAVLSSSAKASASKNCASYAMLRASYISKNIEIDGIAPLEQTPKPSPVNLDATPPRSILKSANKSIRKSVKKSIKTVLFNESNTDLEDTVITPKKTDTDIANGLCPMDIEELDEEKENYKREPQRIRESIAFDYPITRSRAKTLITPLLENLSVSPNIGGSSKKRATCKKVLQETDDNEFKQTPKRSSRTRKSILEDDNEFKQTSKRSSRTRKSILEDDNEFKQTSKRSSRMRKSVLEDTVD